MLVIDEGNSARQIVDDASAPIRSIVIGIVDERDLAIIKWNKIHAINFNHLQMNFLINVFKRGIDRKSVNYQKEIHR